MDLFSFFGFAFKLGDYFYVYYELATSSNTFLLLTVGVFDNSFADI